MSLVNKPVDWMNQVAGSKSKIFATAIFHFFYTIWCLWMMFDFVKTPKSTSSFTFVDILIVGGPLLVFVVLVPSLYLYGAYRLLQERNQKSGKV